MDKYEGGSYMPTDDLRGTIASSYNLTGQTPKLADLVSAFRWIFVTQGVYTQVMATDTEMV